MNCTLCKSDCFTEKYINSKRYYLCNNCKLIFVDKFHLLSDEEEIKRYQHHNNSINDEGYINFLEQIITPTMQFLSKGMSGLDFGCGKEPVLAEILRAKNISCDLYDIYFHKDLDTTKKYDFIFATECFEHFHNPYKEILLITSLLKPSGILSIMTELYQNVDKLKDWHYLRDSTHVCFYSVETFRYICKNFNLRVLYTDNKRVFVLIKD